MKEFYSQICTSVEQSKRLLELGLNPETADCTWVIINGEPVGFMGQTKIDCSKIVINGDEIKNKEIVHFPAWSLHRLLEILDSPFVEFNILSYNPYEEIIYNISECIKYGYISKEYLKQ